MSFAQFLQRRNRTIEAIGYLNCMLLPPLDIKTVSAERVRDHKSVEHNIIRTCVSRECQTDITGDVRPTGANWSEVGDTRRPVLCKVNQKKFLCSLCGLEYKWRSSVYRHVKTDHKIDEEVCSHCYVPFSNRNLLYAHLQRREELGWCRASRGIESRGNEIVVPTPVSSGMPALYNRIEMW